MPRSPPCGPPQGASTPNTPHPQGQGWLLCWGPLGVRGALGQSAASWPGREAGALAKYDFRLSGDAPCIMEQSDLKGETPGSFSQTQITHLRKKKQHK